MQCWCWASALVFSDAVHRTLRVGRWRSCTHTPAAPHEERWAPPLRTSGARYSIMNSGSEKSVDKAGGKWREGAEVSEDESSSLATESSIPEDELEDPASTQRGQMQGPISQAQGLRNRDRRVSTRQGSKLLQRQVAFGEGSAGAHLMREANFMSRHAHVGAGRDADGDGDKATRRWCVCATSARPAHAARLSRPRSGPQAASGRFHRVQALLCRGRADHAFRPLHRRHTHAGDSRRG